MRTAMACILLSLAGCGTDTNNNTPAPQTVPCDQDPWECPAGQTCWTTDGQSAQCLPSGKGQVGDACEPLQGTAGCSDALVCLRQPGWSAGECTPYCDAAHPCPNGEPCTPVSVAGSSIAYRACIPAQGPDAGAD